MDLRQLPDSSPATGSEGPQPVAHSLLAGFARGVFDELPVAVLFFAGPSLIDANTEWTAATGLSVDQSTGSKWLSAVHSDDREEAAACAVFGIDGTSPASADFRIVAHDGSDCWFRAVGRTFDEIGATGGALGLLTLTAVGAHRSTEARLLYQSTHDGLTGLANRSKFIGIVERSLTGRSDVAAMLFIDLDHFKVVNDQLGHRSGDEVLQAVCQRVERTIRPTDLAGRLGGDEIGVFCAHVESVDEVIALAGRVGQALAAPFVVAGNSVIVDSSIGIAFTGAAVETAEALVDAADRAMYTAKSAGGGRWALASATATKSSAPEDERPAHLRVALDGRIAVAQATGMIAQRSGADPDDSAAMLRTYASASNLGVVSAARMLVERDIDIDIVAAERHSPLSAGTESTSSVQPPRRSGNDQSAPLQTIYTEHSAAVYGCARFLCGACAAAVTEETFATFWQQRDIADSSFASVRVRLLTIAHRLAMHAALIEVRAHDDPTHGFAAPSNSVAAVLARGQVIERTLACAHLDATDRSLAALMVHGRCSFTEMARALGEEEDEVKLQLRSVLRHLRTVVAADE